MIGTEIEVLTLEDGTALSINFVRMVIANGSGDIPVNEWVRVRVTDMEQFRVNSR